MHEIKRRLVLGRKVMTNLDSILRSSEVKWTGMREFNSDDHYIYYCRQESLRRNGVVFIVNSLHDVAKALASFLPKDIQG